MTDAVDTLQSDLEDVIAREILAEAEPFDADTDLLLEGLVDSMGVVQLVQWLEDRLTVEIDPADVVIENFRSVRAILAYVERRTGAPGS